MKVLYTIIIVTLLASAAFSLSFVKSGNSEWDVTQIFFTKMKTDYISLIGEKNKFGIKIDEPFIERKKQQVTWKFWGESQELIGKKLTITAESKTTNQKISSLTEPLPLLDDPATEAAASASAFVELPSAGLWRFNLYVNDQLFGQIIVEVRKEN